MYWIVPALWALGASEPAQLGAVNYFRRAGTQLAEGNDALALSDFRRALAADATFVPAQYNLAATYLRLGMAEQAENAADEKNCQDPRCADIAAQAQEYLRLLRSADAQTADDEEYNEDDDAGMGADIARMLVLAPKSTPALRLRARYNLRRGAVIEAVNDLAQVAQLEQSDADAAARAAVGSFVLMDQRNAAFAMLRRCVQFDDSAEQCKAATKRLRRLQKTVDEPNGKIKLKELLHDTRTLLRDFNLTSSHGEDREGDGVGDGALVESVRRARCVALVQRGLWDRAASICARVRDVPGDEEFAPALLAQAHLERTQGNHRAAVELARKIAQNNDADESTREQARQLYMELQAEQQQRQQEQFQQQQQRYQQFQHPSGEPTKDLYKVLGISADADAREVKRAYRQLVKQYHPDKYRGGELDEDAVMAKMQEINEAYETLSDEDRRREYDAMRSGGGGGGGGGGQFGGQHGGQRMQKIQFGGAGANNQFFRQFFGNGF